MGTLGSAVSQFNDPSGIAVDSSGNVYVGDRQNHRIQKFRNNGTFIRTWDIDTADGQIYWPYGVAVDTSANVFVVDHINCRIQKFTNTGTFIRKWGTRGSAVNQFEFPMHVAVDSAGNVYVGDTGNHRIQKFTNDGTYIRTWGYLAQETVSSTIARWYCCRTQIRQCVCIADGRLQDSKVHKHGQFITRWGSQGSADGQFHVSTMGSL